MCVLVLVCLCNGSIDGDDFSNSYKIYCNISIFFVTIFLLSYFARGDFLVRRQSAIQAEGFRSLADGEEVEFLVETDENGRKKASRVTGPGGADVQGAPYRESRDYD